MNNQYEDLELSVTSSDSKVSPEMTKWNRNAKASSPRRRHFEIRQGKGTESLKLKIVRILCWP